MFLRSAAVARVGVRGLATSGASVYRGVFPIMATPFHADETLDLEGRYNVIMPNSLYMKMAENTVAGKTHFY